MPSCGSEAATSQVSFLQVPRVQTGQWFHRVRISVDGGCAGGYIRASVTTPHLKLFQQSA